MLISTAALLQRCNIVLQAFLENPVSAKGTGSSKHRGAKLSLPTDSGQMETFEMRLKKELVELGLLDPPEVGLVDVWFVVVYNLYILDIFLD